MAHLRVRKYLTALFALSLFGTIYFAKNWVVRDFGSDVPNWDQWDAEALQLLLPWETHTLRFLDLFQSHNEHRVALTKVLTLGLVTLNGQWDPRLQMVVNGVLHSALAVAMWFWICPLLTRRWQLVVWTVAIAGTFAPPHAWQNVLGGFHSQQYFLLLLSLVGMDRALCCEKGTRGWWIGMTCLVLAIVSMGAGFFAATSVLLVLLIFNRSPLQAVRHHWPTLLICVAIFTVGFLLRVDFHDHANLKARSLSDFTLTLWRSLQWPLIADRFKLFALLSQVPWLLLTGRVFARRGDNETDPREKVIVAAGIWVLAQFVAAAYARGAGSPWPASRYFDTQTLGILVNLAAMLVLISRSPWTSVVRHVRTLLFTLWSLGSAYGLWMHNKYVLGDMQVIGPTFTKYTQNLRLYLATGDSRWLKEGEIPYPSANALRERVSHPEIVELLPVGVRRALPVKEASAIGFVANGASPATPTLVAAPNWGSFVDGQGSATAGKWQSEIIQPPSEGYLKFELAGDVGLGAVRMELWSADLTTLLTTVAPSKVPGESWRAAYVRTPRQPFRMIAHDADPKAWFAFSAPTTMATGSYWAWRLTAHSPLLFSISLIMMIGALPFNLRRVSGPPNRPPVPN